MFESFKAEFKKVDVDLNTKTKLLCFADATLGAQAGMTGVDKMSLLGVPTSDSARGSADLALKRLAEAFEQLSVLPQVPFGEAMLILRFCVGVRANYLFDQLPSEAQQLVAGVWDPAVERCLTEMFRGQPPPSRVYLFRDGGLGVARQGEQAALSRTRGWARAAAVVDVYLPNQRHLTKIMATSPHPVHEEVRAAYASLPVAARDGEGAYDPLAPPPPFLGHAGAAAGGAGGAAVAAAAPEPYLSLRPPSRPATARPLRPRRPPTR